MSKKKLKKKVSKLRAELTLSRAAGVGLMHILDEASESRAKVSLLLDDLSNDNAELKRLLDAERDSCDNLNHLLEEAKNDNEALANKLDGFGDLIAIHESQIARLKNQPKATKGTKWEN